MSTRASPQTCRQVCTAVVCTTGVYRGAAVHDALVRAQAAAMRAARPASPATQRGCRAGRRPPRDRAVTQSKRTRSEQGGRAAGGGTCRAVELASLARGAARPAHAKRGARPGEGDWPDESGQASVASGCTSHAWAALRLGMRLGARLRMRPPAGGRGVAAAHLAPDLHASWQQLLQQDGGLVGAQLPPLQQLHHQLHGCVSAALLERAGKGRGAVFGAGRRLGGWGRCVCGVWGGGGGGGVWASVMWLCAIARGQGRDAGAVVQRGRQAARAAGSGPAALCDRPVPTASHPLGAAHLPLLLQRRRRQAVCAEARRAQNLHRWLRRQAPHQRVLHRWRRRRGCGAARPRKAGGAAAAAARAGASVQPGVKRRRRCRGAATGGSRSGGRAHSADRLCRGHGR